MSRPTPRVYGLVPAAGLSRRMGVQKLGLRLGNQTVLEHVLTRLNDSLLTKVLVVVGPHSSELVSAVPPGIETLVLRETTAEMRETIEMGLQRLTATFAPGPTDGLLLALGDHPSLRTAVVDALVESFLQQPDSIHAPSFQGKRGHPVLFPWSTLDRLAEIPKDRGLNELFRLEAGRICEVAFPFPDILEDLDVPEDFERFQQRDWS